MLASFCSPRLIMAVSGLASFCTAEMALDQAVWLRLHTAQFEIPP